MKKLLSMILVCVLTFTTCVPAFASETSANANPSSNSFSTVSSETPANTTFAVSNEISPLATSIPTTSHSLPYSATVTSLKAGHGTYTKYYFSPNKNNQLTIGGSLKPSGDQNSKSRKAKIFLYEVGNSTAVDSYTISEFVNTTTLSHTFKNLDEDAHYYLYIKNTGSAGITTSKTIDGTVKIS